MDGKKGNTARKRKKICSFKWSSKPKKNKVNANEVVPVFVAQIGHSSSDCEQQHKQNQQQQLDHSPEKVEGIF